MKDLTRKLTQLTHLTSSENHYRWKNKTHEQVFHSYENIIEKLVEFVSKSNSNSSQSLQDFHGLVSQKAHSNFDPYSTPCLRMKSQYYNKFLKFNDGAKELDLTKLDLQRILYGIWCETGADTSHIEANQAGDASSVVSERLDMLKRIGEYCLKGRCPNSHKGGKLSSSALVCVNPFHYEDVGAVSMGGPMLSTLSNINSPNRPNYQGAPHNAYTVNSPFGSPHQNEPSESESQYPLTNMLTNTDLHVFAEANQNGYYEQNPGAAGQTEQQLPSPDMSRQLQTSPHNNNNPTWNYQNEPISPLNNQFQQVHSVGGSHQPGSHQPGSQQPGSNQPGSQQPGSNNPHQVNSPQATPQGTRNAQMNAQNNPNNPISSPSSGLGASISPSDAYAWENNRPTITINRNSNNNPYNLNQNRHNNTNFTGGLTQNNDQNTRNAQNSQNNGGGPHSNSTSQNQANSPFQAPHSVGQPNRQNTNNNPSIPYRELSVPLPITEHWCGIKYHECAVSVGESFYAVQSESVIHIDGFTDPGLDKNRFSLGSLNNINRTEGTKNVRKHIGHGVELKQDGHSVILTCRSGNPVFIQSPNCNQRYGWDLTTVVKVPNGCNLAIFDTEAFSRTLADSIAGGFEEVYKMARMCSIRMSFVKGWGQEYRRQSIMNTPCWVEIQLTAPLKWIDEVLKEIEAPEKNIGSVS